MRTGLRKPQTRRRGAAAVEFAVVIPVVILMVFGMIELGRGYMVQHILTETARRACRFGTSLVLSEIPIAYRSTGSSYPWNDYVNAVIVTPPLQYSGISGHTVTYYITDWGSTDSTTNSDLSTAKGPNYGGAVYVPGSEVTVKISVPTSNVSWGINQYLIGGTITGQYTLRKE
jgi:Flp pilus assembly protein TadG